jgi:predicted Zn-dependent protease
MALSDGFVVEVLDAAKHLYQIDPIPARGVCVYAVVLMKTEYLDEAERVLQTNFRQHGDDGSVLTNLAKVYSARNQTQKCYETLWHGLEVDPNQENGLAWFAAIHYERGGEQCCNSPGLITSLRPTAWRWATI